MQSRVCAISNEELDDWASSTFGEVATGTDFLLAEGGTNASNVTTQFVSRRCWYLNSLMFIIIFLHEFKFKI